MNRKQLLITIDTEMDADIHWHKSWPPTYSSITVGIPKFLRPIWNQFDVHPIYFVSPEVLYSEECCAVLRDEIAQGAIIGAHLHPEYIEPGKVWGKAIEEIEPQFPNSAYDKEIEKQKIANLTTLIEEKLEVRPIWYRGARFGTDTDTIQSLRELGYEHDSSVTPHIDWSSKGGPNHSKALEEKYIPSKENIYQCSQNEKTGLQEHPVTILGKRMGILGRFLPDNWLFYHWLRPTQMTYFEMQHIIRRCKERQELVMMFHSMEIMIGKTPYVRNQWMQKYYLWRLYKSVEFARKNGYGL